MLEQTSATVYDGQENPLSVTDALGDVTPTTYDNLDRSITTSQGQTVPLASGAATFSNVPQVAGQNRTFAVYVNAAPGSGETTITDSDSGSPTFTFSGSSTTPLGSGWYLLGTVTLAAGDLSSTVTVRTRARASRRSRSCSRPRHDGLRCRQQCRLADRRPGRCHDLRLQQSQQQVSSSQGQIVPLASGSSDRWPTCRRRRAWPGPLRSTSRRVRLPVSGDTTITENGTASPTFTFSGSSATPLGSGWYELGTVTLAAGDASSRLTVAYSGSGVTHVGVVQQTSADTYTPTGLVASQTNADGGVTNYGYDVLGEQTRIPVPPPTPAPTVRPVTSERLRRDGTRDLHHVPSLCGRGSG